MELNLISVEGEHTYGRTGGRADGYNLPCLSF